ncbi:MAG: helix-turn-helix transcriptional regulator [Verrucomicrobia bacterium]|nr:helix-turn-helix transcriptional regulator [Verrucomicrobiota bacterium]MCH8525541.1 helix-turn-helix transcriptional regulator [Kiritimatiellia bacterium]
MSEIETAADCSRYHLSRLFRKETGSSPYATLQDIRIRKAIRLLNHREDSVKEIAWQCGYRDTANFCREFKRRTLNTPTQARKQTQTHNFTSIHQS